MKPVCLAFSAKAGSAKSVLTQRLINSYGFIELSFADKLKQLCRELFPHKMQGHKNDYRWVLQQFGHACREIDPYVWVRPVMKQLDEEFKNVPRIVISDVRYFNEFVALKSRGFKMIRIERPAELRKRDGYNVEDSHASETQLDYVDHNAWDLVIDNRFEYPFDVPFDMILDAFGVDE